MYKKILLLTFVNATLNLTEIRKKNLNQNSLWLNAIFTVNSEDPTCESEPSTSTGKRGRPYKTYEDSSDRTQRRKNKELLDTCGLILY